MKKHWVWCVCLLAWLIGGIYAAQAECQFDVLCSQNTVVREDVVAWIEIAGADIRWPIMRHASDDGFYSSHDASGVESPMGAVYMQGSYNAGDFSDPVTVLYGSSKQEGAPFRDLQELYSGYFKKSRIILLHLPEKTVQYGVFAAVPYSSTHILHYYKFNVERRYNAFFDDVYSTRQLGMHLDKAGRPEYGEQVLILSTGLRGEPMQRYLVMAKRVEG